MRTMQFKAHHPKLVLRCRQSSHNLRSGVLFSEERESIATRQSAVGKSHNLRSGVLFSEERESIATRQSAVGKGEKKERLIAG